MEKALISTLLFSFLYSNVHSAAFPKRTIESFIIHYLEDRRIIPVRVVLNSDQQTEHIVTPVGGETLYDFNQGKVAYRDQNSSQCFIADIVEESLERDRRKLKNIQHGVVRGFYLPTFTIQQEFSNNTELPGKFGVRLTQFCSGYIVSSVARQQHRSKRDTSDGKGQFTHHSYGHYGHQSNNYAHYGHETHITGDVDKDGNIRNQRVSHNQVRSESSHTYPSPSSRSGPQVSTSDSRNGIHSPHYQTQYQIPASQSWDSSGRPFGTGSSGQFALQTNQESGYQVNLPLGLRAGNAYRSGIRSSGQYDVGGPQPQITTQYHRYPDSVSPGIYKPPTGQTGLRQIPGQVPSIPGAPYPPVPSTQTGIPQVDYTQIRDRRIGTPVGVPSYQDLDHTRVVQPLPSARDISLGGLPAQVDHTRIRDRGLGTPVGLPSYQDLDQRRVVQPLPGTRDISLGGLPAQVDHTRIRDRRLGTPVGVPSYQDLDQTRIVQPLPGARDISLGGLPAQVDHMRIRDRGLGTPVGVPSYRDLDQTRLTQPLPGTRDISLGGLPTLVQPGVPASFPSVVPADHRIQFPPGPPGTQIFDTQTDSRRGAPRPPDSGIQTILPTLDQPGYQTTVSQPGISMVPSSQLIPSIVPDMKIPSPYIPGSAIDSQIGLPGRVVPGIGLPGSQTTAIQPPPGISRPGYQVPSTHPDLGRQQGFLPGSTIPSPGLYPPGSYPGLPTLVEPDSRSAIRLSPPGLAATVPGIAPQGTLTRPDEFIQNGVSYPAGIYPQIPGGIRQERPTGVSPRGDIFPGTTGIQPIDYRRIPTTEVRPGDTQLLQTRETGRTIPESIRGYQVPRTGIVPDSPTYPSRVPSTGISPGILAPGDRSVLISQTTPGVSGVYGEGSASSQTQIQTNIEGTAAEASAAGQYRGLGSKTQVQGGYAGNGSFSAQAQSGFTGGVVQSQVQGSKQGGSSGSSAHVERVGAAQSQVQVGQPSGAASSTAQGRFSGGLTQVQAQSGKTGGSAGAQAQSTGLSSSHVQVNIGGKEVSEQDQFQGTVSASVQGGYSSGQAQTQLQGGYDSGRTYVATAQGGFDSTQGFQVSVPAAGSLPRPSTQTVGLGQPLGATVSQESTRVLRQRPTIDSSIPLVTQTGPGLPAGAQITQSTRTTPFDQRGSIPGVPSSSVFTQPSSTLPDQRQPQPGTLPEQSLILPGTVSDRTLGSRTPSTLTETLAPGLPHGPKISTGIPSEDSHLRYPSSIPGIPGSPYLPQISQPTVTRDGYLPYPGYRPDLASIPSGAVAERPASVSQGLPGYTAYDQKIPLPSGAIPGSQRTGLPPVSTGFPGHSIDALRPMPPLSALPGAITPGFQPAIGESLSPFPGLQQPSPFLPTPQQTLHQQYNYTTGMPIRPVGTFQQPSGLVPGSPTYLEPGYTRGYPSGLPPHVQQPGFPTGQIPVSVRPDITGYPGQQTFYPPTLIPGQPQISPSQIPGQIPGQIPVSVRPDITGYPGQQTFYPPTIIPGQPQISPPQIPVSVRPDITGYPGQQTFYPPTLIPGQPQISPPHPQTISPQARPDETRGLRKPDDSQYIGLPPGSLQLPTIPGQPQISPPKPPDSVSPETILPSRIPSQPIATHTTQVGLPGAPEPDGGNCCEALRELKRRCCGKTTRKQNGSSDSSCCRSKTTDFSIDFSSEDDLDDSKGDEPCKVVKAICYIVYKPVGKARVCKPTDTNGC